MIKHKKHLTANNAPIERKEKHDNRFNPDVVKIKAAENVRYEPRWDERNNRPYLVELRLNA